MSSSTRRPHFHTSHGYISFCILLVVKAKTNWILPMARRQWLSVHRPSITFLLETRVRERPFSPAGQGLLTWETRQNVPGRHSQLSVTLLTSQRKAGLQKINITMLISNNLCVFFNCFNVGIIAGVLLPPLLTSPLLHLPHPWPSPNCCPCPRGNYTSVRHFLHLPYCS